MADDRGWEECGVALVRSAVDDRVWSPVLAEMEVQHIIDGAGGLNKAKRYAIEEARRYGHIEPETVAARLRWRSNGPGSMTLEVQSNG